MESATSAHAGDVYLSSTEPDEWEADTDVGGYAHMLFDHGASKAGLWKADPVASQEPPPVEIPARETILVLEGEVRVTLDGGNPYHLQVGDMISIPAGSMVGWNASTECKVFWVYS